MTSTGSGLSVPDWPLSYGQLFPPMIGGIRFEHTHRVIAGIVGILTFGLMVVLLKNEKRVWLKGVGVLAFVMVLGQALLGGLTVIYLLPTPVSVFHACLAQAFFCLLAGMTFFTSKEWLQNEAIEFEGTRSLKRLLVATMAFMTTQLILGAVVRHSAHASIRPHFFMAFLILLHVLFVNLRILGAPDLKKSFSSHSIFIGFLVLAQVFLGLGAFAMTHLLPKAPTQRTAEVLLTASHQTTGALILMLSFLLTLRCFRLLRMPKEVRA